MPGEGGEGNENHEKKKKNKNWTRPEIFTTIHAGLGTNERMTTDRCSGDRMNGFQVAFTTYVRYMASKGMWVDRLGNPVTTVTPEESIQMSCVAITSATKDCPISRQLKDMISCVRNQIAPLLDKLLNSDGTIPSGKNQQEIKEALHKLYFEFAVEQISYVSRYTRSRKQRSFCATSEVH
jgi:hypothetical protein